jgi:uncharacterized protein (DUF1499 family)
MSRVRWGWIGFLVLVLASCGPAAKQEGAMPNDVAFTDFAALAPPDSPNTWLVAPMGFGPARPDETAPTFDVSPRRLAAIWLQIVREQPRTRVLGVSEDGLRIEAAQRSAVFGFTDRISVRFLPVDRGRSTFVAYSRAQVGYWDLGVNRRRLRTWLSALQTRVERKDVGWLFRRSPFKHAPFKDWPALVRPAASPWSARGVCRSWRWSSPGILQEAAGPSRWRPSAGAPPA